MQNEVLANFYERDIKKLIEELNQFKNEANIWKTQGSTKNSAGNLALHIAGGLNHFFGATLAKTGYVRNRDLEFSKKDVQRSELVRQLEEVIPIVTKTINSLSPEQMKADFPIFFDKPNTSTYYVIVSLLAHLSYHTGQVNYLRRILEG